MIKAIFLVSLFAGSLFVNSPKNKSVDSTSLSGDGDAFSLSEHSYKMDESFVYTSAVHFDSGNAAALVFGAKENERYFVFNIDRNENKTKLLYFKNEGSGLTAKEYLNEWYMGNDKVTESELNVIRPKVSSCPEFHLKLVITIEESHAYAEFYIDNIKRFGVDKVIDLNDLEEGLSYKGGQIGFNVFHANVTFDDITLGKSDYSYYTEAYRNQYHYSQFAHWNNDPNGLVYYKGYYHMYYQTHPYSKYWDHMYWGHARSKDLVHWQELPHALFPDDGNMGIGLGIGYAWSGAVRVYHKGQSPAIDALNWFPNGEGEGLLGIYTRDGERQDQVIISSDDQGMTWTKRKIIPQSVATGDIGKVDCRDPSFFVLNTHSNGEVSRWVMLLSGGTQNKFWFLTSEDFLNWKLSNTYDYIYPECMTIYNNVPPFDDSYSIYLNRTIISVSSRYYAIGRIDSDDSGKIHFYVQDENNITKQYDYSEIGQKAFKKMDYAEDSYAAQAFFIDDPESKYYGKQIAMSWFSGLPSDAESGIYAEVRHPWNGGGMTIPVELGLVKNNGEALVTQKPITVDNDDFPKTTLVSGESLDKDAANNLLGQVNTHSFEFTAKIDNPNEEPVEFRVAESEDEYTAFGWNKEDGYYFDRSHTSTAGINFTKNYLHKFASHRGNGKNLSFYALSDNGSLELFCDDFKYVFYGLTLAAPYSIGASMVAEDSIMVEKLQINSFSSIWHDESEIEEGVLYLDQDNLSLDLSLSDSKDVLVFSTNKETISYELVSGEDVISYEIISKGVRIHALANGEAELKVFTPTQSKSILVTVDDAPIDSDISFAKSGVKSGSWMTASSGLIGTMKMGDGYLLSETITADFRYSANIRLEGAAAGLVVRASEGMKEYVVCNIDSNERIVKVFSTHGEFARGAYKGDVFEEISYSVYVTGQEIEVLVNGERIVHADIPNFIPESGYVGFNVFNGKATFNEIRLVNFSYEFNGDDLVINNDGGQFIKAIYNMGDKNSLVNKAYYHQDDSTIIISKDYFALLDENRLYRFYVEGEEYSFSFATQVNSIERSLSVKDMSINEGLDAVIWVGRFDIESVSVNGKVLDKEVYSIRNYCLRINQSNLNVGSNEVLINGEIKFQITVLPLIKHDEVPMGSLDATASSMESLSVLPVVCGAALVLVLAGFALSRGKKDRL